MQILDQNWEGFLFSSEVKYCQIDIKPGQSAEWMRTIKEWYTVCFDFTEHLILQVGPRNFVKKTFFIKRTSF